MDEWYDIVPYLMHKHLVWLGQCSHMHSAISLPLNERNWWKRFGVTTLASSGNIDAIKFLVEKCGVTSPSYGFELPLIYASLNGHLIVVQYLVEICKANVEHCDNVAVKWASESGHLEVVKFLVQNGANPKRALDWASMNGHVQLVRYLVETAGVNVQKRKERALQLANEYGHKEVVQYLLERCEANTHAENDDALQ